MNESSTPSLDEVLGNELYVYQGKVYPRKRLYKTSSFKRILIGVYVVLMLAVILGVAAWSMGVSIAIPKFLLGIEDEAPVVRVRESPVVSSAVTSSGTTTTAESSGGEVRTSADVVSGEVETSVEVVSPTSIATTTIKQ